MDYRHISVHDYPTDQSVRARRDELLAEGRELTRSGDGALTDEAQTRFTTIEAELDELRDLHQRRERVARLSGQAGHTESGDGTTGAPALMRRVRPFDGEPVGRLTRREALDRARAALDDRDVIRDVSDEQREHVERLMRASDDNLDGSYIARRLLATESEHYRSAFARCIEAGLRGRPALLDGEEVRALRDLETLNRAMSIGTDSAGGYGVPVLIDPSIMITAQGTANLDDIFRVSRVETITNDEWKGVTSAGVTWSFDSEGSEVSDDTPTLAQPSVPAHMARGFVPFSIEVSMDYPNLAAELTGLLNEGYMELVSEKVTLGSGSGEPTGFVTKLDATTTSEVVVTTDGAFGAVDIAKVWDALPNRFKRNATWMSSTDVQNEVRQFGSGGSGGANYSVNITQDRIDRLYGREYALNDWMADFTSTTGAANLMVVGDFRSFLVAQRAGLTVEPVQHLFGTNHRPTGQRGLFAFTRVGSDVVITNGLRLLQNQ